MAKNDNISDLLKDVADAIRAKKGTTDLINPQDFSNEIESIESNAGTIEIIEKDVNFRDYDGSILYSYYKDEFLSLNELPPLPIKEGFIYQEWNYEFNDAIDYVENYGILEIGATCITDDGKTRLYISTQKSNQKTRLYIKLNNNNGIIIDWGDNTTKETITDISGSIDHYYENKNNYIITIEVMEGCVLTLGRDSSTVGLLGRGDLTDNTAYNVLSLTKVNLGERVIISSFAFKGCKQLKNINIPNNITDINVSSFEESNLSYITIPKSVKNIKSNAFFRNYSLEAISISNKVTIIEKESFAQCYRLKYITFPTSINIISEGCCSNNTGMVKIIIPKTITTIKTNAFTRLTGITSVFIPNSVVIIEDIVFQVFYSCEFFDFSTHLQIPSLGGRNVFYDYNGKIIVPDNLYDDWIIAENWSYYSNKIIKSSEYNQ